MMNGSTKTVCFDAHAPHGPEWLPCETETGARERTADGALLLSDTAIGEFQCRLMYRWRCNLEHTARIEACVKVIRCEGRGGCGIAFGDGTRGGLLTLFPDRIEYAGATGAFPFRTTDGFHTYRIEADAAKVRVWVDDRPALTAAIGLHPCREQVAFGGFGHPGAGLWKKFHCEYRERVPLQGGRVAWSGLHIVRVTPMPYLDRLTPGPAYCQYDSDNRAAEIIRLIENPSYSGVVFCCFPILN